MRLSSICTFLVSYIYNWYKWIICKKVDKPIFITLTDEEKEILRVKKLNVFQKRLKKQLRNKENGDNNIKYTRNKWRSDNCLMLNL